MSKEGNIGDLLYRDVTTALMEGGGGGEHEEIPPWV